MSDVVAIAAGGAHCMALTADGSLWTWGGNWDSQLGLDGNHFAGQNLPTWIMDGVMLPADASWQMTARLAPPRLPDFIEEAPAWDDHYGEDDYWHYDWHDEYHWQWMHDWGWANRYEFIIWDSHLRYLHEDDLMWLGQWELEIARNEIYARHGRLFARQDLQEYFWSRSWYWGWIEPGDFHYGAFNNYERQNIEFIQAWEIARGY